MTSVQGYAELILEEVEGSPVAEDLHRIHSAAGQLVTLADRSSASICCAAAPRLEPGDSPPQAVEAAAALAQPSDTEAAAGWCWSSTTRKTTGRCSSAGCSARATGWCCGEAAARGSPWREACRWT